MENNPITFSFNNIDDVLKQQLKNLFAEAEKKETTAKDKVEISLAMVAIYRALYDY